MPLRGEGGALAPKGVHFPRAKGAVVWFSPRPQGGFKGFIHQHKLHTDELATSDGFSPFGAYGTTFATV